MWKFVSTEDSVVDAIFIFFVIFFSMLLPSVILLFCLFIFANTCIKTYSKQKPQTIERGAFDWTVEWIYLNGYSDKNTKSYI